MSADMVPEPHVSSLIKNQTVGLRLISATAFGAGVIVILLGMVSPGEAAPHGTAVLRGLDKVTARVSTIQAPIGLTVRFGTLEVIVRHCDKRPPEEPPESAAFMDIWEIRSGEAAISLYRGWMFASSPALSALEHPVYDIWVLDCGGEVLSGDVPIVPPAGRGGQGPKLPDLEKLFKLNNYIN